MAKEEVASLDVGRGHGAFHAGLRRSRGRLCGRRGMESAVVEQSNNLQ